MTGWRRHDGRVLVRECTDRDVPVLEQHLPTGAARVHAAHRARARTGRTSFLVVWEQSRPLGSCVVVWPDAREQCPEPHPHTPAPEIAHLFVGEQHRGRGAGTALLRFAEELILSRGHDRSVIGVEVSDVAAARLYERLGYVPTGELETYEYTWVDTAGREHPITETARRLSKALKP